MRPERLISLERLVRHELTLQRLLAVSRRAASARMSTIRRAKAASVPAIAIDVALSLLRAKVA